MNKHIEQGNPDFAGYPGEDEADTISALREVLANIEQENRLLEKAVAANNELILYLFGKEKR